MAKLRRIGAAVGVGLLAGALIAGPAGAAPGKTLDALQGKASGSTLTLDLLGRHLSLANSEVTSSVADSVKNLKAVDAVANGGTLLGGKNAVANLANGALNKQCATDLGQTTSAVQSLGVPVVSGGLACATASVTGASPVDFTGLANGSIAKLDVKAGDVIATLVNQLAPVIDQVKDSPVGDVITSVDSTDVQATTALNGLFDQLVGQGNVVLPNLNLNQTVGSLLDSLKSASTTLATLDLGEATAKNIGAASTFTAESTNTAGAIEVLPNVLGIAHNAPLLKISLGASKASVAYDKVKQGLAGVADNTIVYVESPLLPLLKLGQVNVAGALTLKDLTDKLGYDAGTAADGSNYIAVKPGQSLSLFCDPGSVTALCTEITVGAVKPAENLANGGMRIESSAVSIHALKNISDLVPGTGTILANSLLDPVLGASTKTTDGGLSLDIAGSVAQVTPALVEPAVGTPPVPGTLAHTGGSPWLAVIGGVMLVGFVALRRTALAAR
jgi:hypothetical protein